MTGPDTMLAARLRAHGGPDALELTEVPVPSPAPGEVLVKVSATALNNTDLWTREGAYGLPEDPDAQAGWRGPIAFPRIQGADVAGTVVRTGPGVDAELRDTRVLAVSSAEKLTAGHDAGADEVIDRTTQGWDQITTVAPEGIDVVLDVVAGEGIATGLASVRDGGRWVVAGALGGYALNLDIRRLYLHNIALIGSSMHTPAHFRTSVDIARQGQVRPVVAATYPLSEVHQAQAELASRQHVGKLVLKPE